MIVSPARGDETSDTQGPAGQRTTSPRTREETHNELYDDARRKAATPRTRG